MNTREKSLPPSNSTNVRLPLTFRLAGGALRLIDTIAPVKAARVAADVFLTPRRMRRPSSEARWHGAAVGERRRLAGFDVSVWSWGEVDPDAVNRPVLLVHGWEGRGAQLGAFAERVCRDGVTAIAPDMPAHGSSGGKRTNLLEFAAVVAALIKEFDPSAIIAHSFGAAAVTVALREVPFDGKLVYVAPPEDFGFFTRTFGGMLGISEQLAMRMQAEVERRFDVDWSVLRGTAIAPLMHAPLLVIHDEEDVDVPHAFGKALVGAWPGARLMSTCGLGHRRILRDKTVVEAAASFINTDLPVQAPWPARGNALASSF